MKKAEAKQKIFDYFNEGNLNEVLNVIDAIYDTKPKARPEATTRDLMNASESSLEKDRKQEGNHFRKIDLEQILDEKGYIDDGDGYEYTFTYSQLQVFSMAVINHFLPSISEEKAMEFAEWLIEKHYEPFTTRGKGWTNDNGHSSKTTQELFTIFKSQTK